MESPKVQVDQVTTDLDILHQKSKPTSYQECKLLGLFQRLPAAMHNAWVAGVGISAIQIGVPLQFAYYEIKEKRLFIMNPKILDGRKLTAFPGEGCLSIINKRFTTYRFMEIDVEYLFDGLPVKRTLKGYEAHVFQHEVDHMNGVLCCDKKLPGRNDPCFCESGIKFKKCCYDK